jgi:putative membrane-bound dehydrogenase-like protein
MANKTLPRWMLRQALGARALSFFSIALACLAPATPAADPLRPRNKIEINGHTFTLPVGFTIELAAGPPQVDRPITASFDEQGRLYVSDSSGSNEKVAVQLEKKPHRIVRLESTKGDGHFDKSTVFADHMMFPEGTLWHAGSLYVAAPPSIWKLTDTTGNGVADQREEWFLGKTLTGCANDLHGPYLGPDGWIYWCKGAFAQQSYDNISRPGQEPGTPYKTRASHVFRCRPDGSGLEPVMAGGMDNPVGLTFTPGGERIISCTFLQFPAGGKRDGLLHVVYGGVYGKDWDPIYEHPWTGPAHMPVLSHLGPAAPAGMHRYESSAFGPEYKDNLFTTLFNLQKVTRHVLTPDGATFTSRDEDFVVSDNKDFHPTDVLEDADGSLLIVDTGGWYKLCCPSSQLYKPDIKGAIYRVRRTRAAKIDDPRGLQIDWSNLDAGQLTKLLDDKRPAVRHRAIQVLGGQGEAAVKALTPIVQTSSSAEARRNAVWALTRIEDPKAYALVRAALASADETVRQAALHSISLRRDREAEPELIAMLKNPDAQNCRAAAEALGRIGSKAATPAFLAACAQTFDRFLEHSLTFALMEIGDVAAISAGLKNSNPSVRRAALIALDQMHAKLEADMVTRDLTAADATLKETAWWIASRHPEWGGELSRVLQARLGESKLTAAERDDLVRQLAKLAKSPAIQTLLAEQAVNAATGKDARQAALRAMAQAGLKKAPAEWLTALTKVLDSGAADGIAPAVTTARALAWEKQRPAELIKALKRIGQDTQLAPEIRLTALAAIPDGVGAVDSALFTVLRSNINGDQPVALRSLATDVLAHAKLDTAQLVALAEALPGTGPMELDRLLDAFAKTNDERVGQKLLQSLQAPSARAGLRVESLKPRLAKYGPSIQKEAQKLYESLNADLGKQQARLEEMLTTLPAGDVRRGQVVFNNPKAACITCHSIGYVGGKIGPDLTRIGSIRTERDLLEAIVFPNSSFVRGYEPVLVTLHSGKTVNGIIRSDAPDEIVLVLSADKEERISRSDIEEMQPGRVSLMPSGLDQQLSRQDLADLVAFLRGCK